MYYKFEIKTLDGKRLTAIIIEEKTNQAVCNTLVEIGFNPLLCTWELAREFDGGRDFQEYMRDFMNDWLDS